MKTIRDLNRPPQIDGRVESIVVRGSPREVARTVAGTSCRTIKELDGATHLTHSPAGDHAGSIRVNSLIKPQRDCMRTAFNSRLAFLLSLAQPLPLGAFKRSHIGR